MKLPIDLKELIDEATNIDGARNTPLSVSVYVDNAAQFDLVAHVRNMFASSLPSVRMTVSYLDASFQPHPGDDAAIIVAGSSTSVGPASSVLRASCIPVMIVTTEPTVVQANAAASHHEIPEGDLVTPEIEEGATEPIAFNDEVAATLNDRMGRWLVAACYEKRLALSVAFPFMRRPLAREAVQLTALQNAGIGLLPLFPGGDLPIMTLNQAKMVLQIAAAYGREMDKDRVKGIGVCVGGAFVCRTLARELTEFLPLLGWVIKPGIAYGGTEALGHAVIEYFEGGENVTGVAAVVEKATQTGTKFANRAYEIAQDPSSFDLAGKVDKVSAKVSSFDIPGKVATYGPVVREGVEKAAELAPVLRDSIVKAAPVVLGAVGDYVKSAVSPSAPAEEPAS